MLNTELRWPCPQPGMILQHSVLHQPFCIDAWIPKIILGTRFGILLSSLVVSWYHPRTPAPPRYWRTSSIFHVNLSYVSCLEANHQTEKKISKAFKGKVFIFEFPFRKLTAWLAWPACYSLCRLSYFNLTILVFDLVEKLFIIILL